MRKKPVKVADLADDVEIILKIYKDKYWTGFEVLKELKKINAELDEGLSWWNRIKLSYYRGKLIKDIEAHDGDVVYKLKNTINC